MTRIHTHYDNLKVARNAPPEVIRAAYKTLSQKFHPDRNPGNAEAARIMMIINTSYEVLSDPDKRREHDLWLSQQEQAVAQATKLSSQSSQAPRQTPTHHYPTKASSEHRKDDPWLAPSAAQATKPSSQSQQTPRQAPTPHPSRNYAIPGGVNWILYGVVAFFIWIWASDKPSPPTPGPKPYQANPPPVRPVYVRPGAAPNGTTWPVSADYINGYQLLHADGLSTVTVDNSRNDSDVFVKLVSLDSARAYPVRQFYIPAFTSFTLNKVTSGSYDIRYRDLSNGGLSRSEAFNLKEIATYNGTQFSNITMTLYKVQNGNMQTYGLSEAEF